MLARRLIAGVFGLAGSVLLVVAHTLIEWSAVNPIPLDRLGLNPDHVAASQMVAAELPPFHVVGDNDDHTGKNVRLWDAVLQLRGEHWPNYPQEIGDCVSFGAKNALEALQCVQCLQSGGKAQAVFPPYIYGYSRVQIGKRQIRGDGSVGAWAAEGVTVGGVLSASHAECPRYTGAVATEWGRNGPPKWAIDAAKNSLVRTIAQIKTAEEGCRAIANGYPFTIASNFGTKTIRQVDGRQVARWDGNWGHQMCVLGYDGTANSGKKYFYVLNSWGPDAHPKPLQGEPPGGFWVTWEDLDRIVKQGDSWAFSSFDGFRKTDIDWSVFKGAELGPVEVIAIMFSDTWYGFFCGAGFICLLLAFWVNRPQLPHLRRRIPYQMSLLLLASLMTSQLVAAERVTFRAWHEDGSKTVFREWGDQRVMFAAWSDERPVVTAYTPEWCVQCKLLKKTLGDGDERFRMRYVSDEKSYPAFIQQYVVTNDPATGQPRGYPVMHWAALNGRARMVHGSRWSRDQVWAFVSGN